MELTKIDRERIAEWLNTKCGLMRCTCCGFSQWEIVGMATLPIAVDLHTTRFYYSQGIPQIALACINCGHMVFFNAHVIGFRPDEPPQVEVPPDSSGA